MSQYAILQRTVQRAVQRGYIPSNEQQAVYDGIVRLAQKYQFSPDDFAILSMTETDGLDPKAYNGNCGGIIQFCNGTGASTVGSTAEAIRQMSVLEQLPLVDRYFKAQGLPQGADLADLYLTVLWPAGVGEKNLDRDLGIPCCQAHNLHTSPGNNVITKRSIIRGLREKASQKLGTSVDGSLPPPSGGALPGDYSAGGASSTPSTANALGIKSAIFAGKNCPPPPYNQRDRIIYTGCQSVLSSFTQAGLGVGFPAPGVGGMNGGQPGLAGSATYNAPLRPGGFIVPMKKGDYVVTSEFGPRWGRNHNGIDLAGDRGKPVFAAADGKVTHCTDSGDCAGNMVTINHAGGDFTNYFHLDSIMVSCGQLVKQGQQIGTVGTTPGPPCSTGYHLHFEYGTPSGGKINPRRILSF